MLNQARPARPKEPHADPTSSLRVSLRAQVPRRWPVILCFVAFLVGGQWLADDYGLSLILGGAEASLWDLAGMYASMARCVNDYHRFNGKYIDNELRAPNFEWKKSITHQTDYKPTLVDETVLSAGSCYATLDALLELARPEGESEWMNFSSSRRVAWKTGTSYGYRDAWAIGVTPTHVVAVWAGNADGEGRPGLIGLYAAAPILFDLFDMIHTPNTWFDEPFDDMEQVTICKKSGHRASDVGHAHQYAIDDTLLDPLCQWGTRETHDA